MGICPYTRLFAACHVLLRLREPRHPSCALLLLSFYFFETFLKLVKASGVVVARLFQFFLFDGIYIAIYAALPVCQCAPFSCGE